MTESMFEFRIFGSDTMLNYYLSQFSFGISGNLTRNSPSISIKFSICWISFIEGEFESTCEEIEY
jgi:hypothetical protein